MMSKYREGNRLATKEYRKRKRLEVIEFFGGKCVRCGFSDIRALQIDHKNGGGTKDRKRQNNFIAYYRYVLEHADEFQCLCANCNWIKRCENPVTESSCRDDYRQRELCSTT